jgi:predicted acylesterase/phospholipase RssA
MRGTVSAGMAFALHELGLVTAFDAVYGASAGAITAAWLLSRPEGLRGWTEPAHARAFIRRSGLVRGRPVADVRALIEELYQTTFPMDFAAVLASPIEFHPLATDAATGQSTDLRPFVGDPAELRLALRASAAPPLLAGPPVEFAGRRFDDAGLSESVPYRTALAQGATHVLVLRSRRDPVTWPDGRAPSRPLWTRRAPEGPAPIRLIRPLHPSGLSASGPSDDHEGFTPAGGVQAFAIMKCLTRGGGRRRRAGHRRSRGGPRGCRWGHPRPKWRGARWLPPPRRPNGIRYCG